MRTMSRFSVARIQRTRRSTSGCSSPIVSARPMSLCDRHSDGSGVCLSPRLRPLWNMRPSYLFAVARGAHQLGADTQLVSWLKAGEYEYDVFTDEDLHAEGASLLSSYRVVFTGRHPEYWTREMLDGFEDYLGGNGFNWVTSIDPHRPHIVEMRRSQSGTRTRESAPGENYHSSTGELGGLWRHRGLSPQRLVGVGFTAQGLGQSSALPAATRELR
jgi:N,N-dimethylformamidase